MAIVARAIAVVLEVIAQPAAVEADEIDLDGPAHHPAFSSGIHFTVLTYRRLPCGCGHRSIVEHLVRASCWFARMRRSVAKASASLLPPLTKPLDRLAVERQRTHGCERGRR